MNARRTRRGWASFALVAMFLATVVPTSTATAASGDAPMLMGFTVRGDQRAELDSYIGQQGKAPALSMLPFEPQYFDEPQAWTKAIVRDMNDRGVTPWIEWVSRDTAALASGAQDEQIRNFYASITDVLLDGTGRSVIIAPQPESNLDEHEWSRDPIAFQQGFRRLRRMAHEAGLGAEQVRFAFSMNGHSSGGRTYADFYPGDEHVDIVAFARLNPGNDHPTGWRNYDDVFAGPIATMRAEIGTTKPIIVAQTASGQNGGDREAWIREMFRRLPDEPDVIGAIWFNTVRGSDWRVHSEADGIPLSPAYKSGYDTWSGPTARNWIFDGSLDDWVTARGGKPAVWPPIETRIPTRNVFAADMGSTSRIGATSPTQGAIDISKARFAANQAEHVVLSRDDKFPDALAGTPLLGEGPLLLTPTASLSADVRAELDRTLAPGRRVYLLGGPGALAPGIEEELDGAGYDVMRLNGPDRFATARAIAEEVARRYPASADRVLVARGFGTATNETAGWADSVTGGAYAAWTNHPVILTPTGELGAEARAFLDGKGGAVILGGPGAVSEAVEAEISTIVGGVLRIAGDSREATAADVYHRLWQRHFGSGRVILIDGHGESGWAHGLPAAGLAADFAAPLLPVARDALPAGTADVLRSCGSKKVQSLVVGSTSVISQGVLTSIEAHDASC